MTDEKQEVAELTEQQAWDVLMYAQELSGGSLFSNALSPYLINERMKDITMNPRQPTEANVESALLAPKSNEENLQAYSEHFELTSMIYKRMLNYLSNLLSFDLTYTPINATKEDMKKSTFKRDLQVVHEFLDRFDAKKEFKLVMKQLLRQETFFGVFRDDGERYTLQELPSGYCKIDGRWDYGLLFAFDFDWFSQAGVDIDMYPPVFKQMYTDKMAEMKGYRPSTQVSLRNDSRFVDWVDCSPMDNFWAFKLSPEVITRVPYLAGLFPDLVLQPLIRTLKKNTDIISATKILFGEVPLIQKDVKGSVVKDQVAVSPELLGKFLGLIRKGLDDTIKLASAPLTNMQGISFPQENRDMYDDFLRTTTASSGLNSRLIFSTEKPTALESQLSVDVDEQLMMYLYPFFNDFLNFHINRRTKKFKFNFEFEGTEFSTNREKRFETQMRLAEKGIVLPQKISASLGMHYHQMIKQMQMGEADEFMDMLTPIINSSNLSVEERGRPQKSVSDLTDSGDQTRADGGNIDKGGKV